MFSGLPPPAHTVRTNDGSQVPAEVKLVAEALSDAGYETAAFVGAAVLHSGTGIARGFARFDEDVGAAGTRRADDVADRAAAWLTQRGRRPFFAWVHFFDPHLPYDPPEPYRSRYAGRPYDGEVAYTDAAVARLLAVLEERNLLQHTVVIVASDHGEALGEHGERSHGVMLYEPTMRVPLLVRLPQAAHGGRAISVPVSVAEIGPTILDLARLPRVGIAESLLTRIEDPDGGPADPVFFETLYLHRLLGWSPLYGMRMGTSKIIDAPKPELYNLDTDPGESSNLAGVMREETARLRAVLHAGLTAAGHVAAHPARPGIDPEAASRLAALGYLSGDTRPVRPVEPVGGIDIKDRIELWVDIEWALEHSQQGAHHQAADGFEAVLQEDPENVLALKFLGAHALAEGDLARAVQLNERVVASGLHVADAASNLALAFHRQGRSSAGLEAIDQALVVSANHLPARINRATILADLGRRKEALAEVERVLAELPTHAGARGLHVRLTAATAEGLDSELEVARRQLADGDLAGARQRLLQVLELRSDDAEAYDLLGTVHVQAGDLAAAQRAFEASLAREPLRAERIERLAAVLHQTGDLRGARARFEQALQLDRSRPAPRLSLAILDLETGDPASAIRRLESITAGWEGAAHACFYLGEARRLTGDLEGARRAYLDAVRLSPPGDPLGREAAKRLQ
jgi:choline-sulfatase